MVRSDGIRKVGCSTNTRRRRGELRDASGLKHVLEKQWKMPMAVARITERLVHFELKPVRFNDGGSLELYALPLKDIEAVIRKAKSAAKELCPNGTLELTDEQVIEIAKKRSPFEVGRAAMGVAAWEKRLRAAKADKWENPKSWRAWSSHLLAEMHLHGYPFGRIDPNDYREYWRNGISPHQAIEEEVNYAE